MAKVPGRIWVQFEKGSRGELIPNGVTRLATEAREWAGDDARVVEFMRPTEGPAALVDSDLLEAIRKGSFDLKVKKLKALGLIEGPAPRLKITAEGKAELCRGRSRS